MSWPSMTPAFKRSRPVSYTRMLTRPWRVWVVMTTATPSRVARCGIGRRPVARSLRPDHDDRAGQVAHHEAECGGREMERVRALGDDDARGAGAEFLRHFPSEALPVLRF